MLNRMIDFKYEIKQKPINRYINIQVYKHNKLSIFKCISVCNKK